MVISRISEHEPSLKKLVWAEYSGLKRAVRADSECRSSGKSVRLARGISADSYNGYMRSEKDVNNHFGGLDYDRLPQDPTA